MVNSIPHDLESEKALLGICILNGRDAVDEIQLQTHTSGLFYDERNAELWRRIERLAKANKAISLSTVSKDKIEYDIPRDYLDGIENESLPISFISTYLETAIAFRKRREALFAAQDLLANAQVLSTPIDTVIDQAEQSLFASRFSDDKQATLKESIFEAINDWETAIANKGQHSGIDSGFADLDYLTWGFQPRNLIIIGARPSQGKTALLCNIAEHAAVCHSIPTLFFSLEMTQKELVKRMICSMGHLSSSTLRAGELSENQIPKITNTAGKLNKSPLTIIDKGSVTVNQIRSIARRHVSKYGIKLILIDYLQKVRPSARHEKRTYEVGEVSTGLKELAKELNVPVIVACQLNRENEKDKGRAPRPSDLGDSGMIERDADIIATLYRHPQQEQESTTHSYSLFIQKHRDGPCGVANLTFIRYCTRFESAPKIEEDSVPSLPFKD
jgi:replicative DNA helicase